MGKKKAIKREKHQDFTSHERRAIDDFLLLMIEAAEKGKQPFEDVSPRQRNEYIRGQIKYYKHLIAGFRWAQSVNMPKKRKLNHGQTGANGKGSESPATVNDKKAG